MTHGGGRRKEEKCGGGGKVETRGRRAQVRGEGKEVVDEREEEGAGMMENMNAEDKDGKIG